jgi:peptidoglycan/LPS O-acetylase OafA/YrhL
VAAPRQRPGFRTDIEGLRAVGIVAVVLFHIGLGHVSGGYVGVDVFFAISGFLICDRLVASAESNDGIGLFAFWSRRLRRLAPALAVVILATVALGLFVYSPLRWSGLGRDATWSALYVSNLSFGASTGGYFQDASSPLLHTWSLAVEEQFYVLWPLALVTVLAFAARVRALRRVQPRTIATVVLAGGAVGSFVLCLLLTHRYSPWAYFSAFSRAWEFAAGGLLAVWARRRADVGIAGYLAPTTIAHGVGAAGLVLVVFAAATFDEVTRFPGVAALIPVTGTVMVMAAGPYVLTGRVLSLAPVRYVGRISYSWYLWHWPAIVLLQDVVGHASVAWAALGAIVSLVLAALTYPLVEVRLRDAPRWQPTRVAVVTGIAVSLVVAGIGVITTAVGRRAVSGDPRLVALQSVRDERRDGGGAGCEVSQLDSGLGVCVYGSPSAAHRVLVVGDSHAAQWIPALESLTDDIDLQLVVSTRGGCAATPIDVARTGRATASPQCERQREQSSRIMDEWRPDLVLVGQADYTSRMLDGPRGATLGRDAAVATATSAARRFATDVTGRGIRLGVLGDNPTQSEEPIECLARRNDIERCSRPRTEALASLDRLRVPQTEALRAGGAAGVFDPVPLICDEQRCLVERDGTVVYADRDHLARPFVARTAAELGQFVDSLLR